MTTTKVVHAPIPLELGGRFRTPRFMPIERIREGDLVIYRFNERTEDVYDEPFEVEEVVTADRGAVALYLVGGGFREALPGTKLVVAQAK